MQLRAAHTTHASHGTIIIEVAPVSNCIISESRQSRAAAGKGGAEDGAQVGNGDVAGDEGGGRGGGVGGGGGGGGVGGLGGGIGSEPPVARHYSSKTLPSAHSLTRLLIWMFLS